MIVDAVNAKAYQSTLQMAAIAVDIQYLAKEFGQEVCRRGACPALTASLWAIELRLAIQAISGV